MTATIDNEPVSHGGGVITLVEGSTFCVSGRSGDMDGAYPQGLFVRDTRIISDWHVRLDDSSPQVMAVMPGDPYSATFVSRMPPLGAQTQVLLERRRYVGDGMREDLRVRNLGGEPVTLRLTVRVGADFADLFEVKESRVVARSVATATRTDTSLMLETAHGRGLRGVLLHAQGGQFFDDRLEFAVGLAPGTDWSTSIFVQPLLDDAEPGSTFPSDLPVEDSSPARRMRAWRDGAPRLDVGDASLRKTLQRSMEDLGALRIFDPANPGSVAVAAGAPWFMALFGRDSLLASFMALPLDPMLALGTLRTLARLQGSTTNVDTEEQPGRILHETRFGPEFPLVRGGGSVYYGSIDSTPLFVVLLGELRRWGIAQDAVEDLLPHADRALDWIENYGDRDGDGFVEYARLTSHGLVNQGWKDSFDGITFADGRVAEPPIALAEVQGYVYAAYVARSHFAYEAGDEQLSAHWARKAAELKRAFNEKFWLPDKGWFAVGLDAEKRPIDSLASNMGHCLWTGIVDEDKAARVGELLVSPEMFSGWGVRTLATSMAAYNPMSYHNGSVWPHDNAILATGLMRYGMVDSAQRVAQGILAAAASFEGSLPELFCGFDRSEYAVPLPYPTSCSPQAWAAATPVQLLRTLLRIDPWFSRNTVWFDPAWPASFGPLQIDLLLGGQRATVRVDATGSSLTGLTAVEVIHAPRQPLGALDA